MRNRFGMGRVATSIAMIALLGSCRGGPVGPEAPDAEQGWHGRPPNVVLVSVDTLRADYLAEAAFLTRLATEGRRFTNAYASSNWTLPSHVSLFTSRPYVEHNLPGPGTAAPHAEARIPKEWSTVAEALKGAGYATFATTEGGWLNPRYGLAAGFDRFERSKPMLHGGNAVFSKHLSLVNEFLGAAGDDPFFLFVHTYWVHDYYVNSTEYHDLLTGDDAPYAELGNLLESADQEDRDTIPEEFVRRLYTAGVRRADSFLEELVALVIASSVDQPLLVFVTSDHGESLGERGQWGHASSLDDEQIRVPFIARVYGGTPVAGRVDRPVSTIDVAPSILRWLGIDAPDGFRGQADLLLDASESARPPVLTRFYQDDLDRPLLGRIGQALMDGDVEYKRVDRYDGSGVSETCALRSDGLPVDAGDTAGAAPDCVSKGREYARLRAAFGCRSVVVRAERPVRLTVATQDGDVIVVHPAVPSTNPLVLGVGGVIEFSPDEHGDSLVLYPGGPGLRFEAIEVADRLVTKNLGLAEMVADGAGVRRWAAAIDGQIVVSLSARGFDPDADDEVVPPSSELIEQLRALGYLE